MYLSLLSNEKKHLFLELEIYMSKTDGDFSDEEKAIIDAHCIEMHIDNNSYECELPLEGVLSKISSEFSEQEKRIVFLELAATVLADKVYHTTEKILISKWADILKISEDESNVVITLIKSLKDAYEGCAKFIEGE